MIISKLGICSFLLLLVSTSLYAQPEDVIGWEGIPWCSGHDKFQERFAAKYKELSIEQVMQPFAAHYQIQDYEIAGYPFDIQLWEDLNSHGITMVRAFMQSHSEEKINDGFLDLQLKLSERYGQPSESLYDELGNSIEAESMHWYFPSTQISLTRRTTKKKNFLSVFFRAPRSKTRCE